MVALALLEHRLPPAPPAPTPPPPPAHRVALALLEPEVLGVDAPGLAREVARHQHQVGRPRRRVAADARAAEGPRGGGACREAGAGRWGGGEVLAAGSRGDRRAWQPCTRRGATGPAPSPMRARAACSRRTDPRACMGSGPAAAASLGVAPALGTRMHACMRALAPSSCSPPAQLTACLRPGRPSAPAAAPQTPAPTAPPPPRAAGRTTCCPS